MSTGKLRATLTAGAHRFGRLKLSLGPAGFGFETDATLPNTPVDPYQDLVAFLRVLAADAKQAGVGVALLIDELQIFKKRDLAVLIQALSALKHEPIVLIGAGLPYLPSEMSKANTYAERFRFEQIDVVHDADARDAVECPAFDQGVPWTKKAIDGLLVEAFGYPYFLQLYASESWIAADSSPTIVLEHVLQAGDPVRRQLDPGLYAARYDRLSEREREYVDAIAQAMAESLPDDSRELGLRPARIATAKIAAIIGKPLTALAPIRDRVVKKGIIHSPQFGALEFSVPGSADYVSRRSTGCDL